MGPSKIILFFLTTAFAKIKKLDPDVFKPLYSHQGKMIVLNIHSVLSGNKKICLFIASDQITVSEHHHHTQNPDLTISGKLFDLGRLGLAFLNNNHASQSEWMRLLHQHHIQCYGDTGLLHALQAVFKQVDLDWTVLWASIVGDKLAFPVSQLFQKSKQYVYAASANNAHSLKEYLLYEKNCFVTAAESEQWIDDIMTLKNDTERLEKNLQLLNARIEKL